MAEKDDAFLGEHGVDEDDDWVGVGATGREVRVEHEGLGTGGVGGGKGLDELDQGEVANGFRRDASGDFDWHGDTVVDYFGLELVGVPGDGIFLCFAC